jgi:hypothetical protein
MDLNTPSSVNLIDPTVFENVDWSSSPSAAPVPNRNTSSQILLSEID